MLLKDKAEHSSSTLCWFKHTHKMQSSRKPDFICVCAVLQIIWNDTDLSKNQAAQELRVAEKGGIAAPQKRALVCSWYNALLTPWVATNSRFMSDWDTGDQCLLPAEMPAISWAVFSSAVSTVTSGAQFPPSPAAVSPWGLDDPGTGELLLSTRGVSVPAGSRAPTFIEAKNSQPALFFSSEKPHVRQVCLLPSTRESGSNCGRLW